MGILSDTLEFNRTNILFDPCMVIPTYKNQEGIHNLLWEQYCKHEKEKGNTISLQGQTFQQTEKDYLSFRFLVDICILREKQLLELYNQNRFTTSLVNGIIESYLSAVRENISYARKKLEESKRYLYSVPQYIFSTGEKEERNIIIKSLIGSIFHNLANEEIDNSQFVHSVFNDTSKLIYTLRPEMSNEKPKIACRDYYEINFHPSFGISRCENCGQLLFSEFPYCFNCFERS